MCYMPPNMMHYEIVSPIVVLPKTFLSEFSQTFRPNIYRKKKNKIMRQQGNNQTNPESGTFLKDNRLRFFKKSMWLVGQGERAVRSWVGEEEAWRECSRLNF